MAGAQELGPVLLPAWEYQQGAGLEAEQLGLKLTLTWDTSDTGGGLMLVTRVWHI